MSEDNPDAAATQRLLVTLDRVPAAVAVLRGHDLIYEYANDAYRELIPTMAPGLRFGARTPQGQRFRELALRALETLEPIRILQVTVENLGPAHDRRGFFDLTLQPTRGAVPEDDGIVVLGVDVTELVLARSALEAQIERSRVAERQLQTVLDNAPILLFAFDKDGRYTMTAGREADKLARKPGELVGQTVWQRHRNEPHILDHARRALAGETFVAQVRRGPHVFEEHYCPWVDKDGEPQGVIGVSVDATARIHAEEERARIQEKMLQAQKLESLGVLAGGIAHDFNNLLTVIQGNAGLALSRLPESHGAWPLLDDVVRASQRASELTKQMLAYSGRARFQIRPLDLGTLAGEIASLLRSSLPKKVELRLDLEKNLPAIQGDAAQLHQILMNLVINGAEAIGDAPGEVIVSLASEDVADGAAGELVGQERLPAGRYVRLAVADSGSGMDAETRSRIFDPFFTTKATGRGLGLAAVLGIVRSHHGALRIRSQPGAGTIFEVLLPAAGARAGQPGKDPEPASGKGTVLVVDDEPFVRSATCRIVASFGYDVLETEDGARAVELFRARGGTIDAVILDLTMPRMSGEETLRELRRVDQDVKVIVFSGYAEAEVYERLGPVGGAAILQKPFTPQQLARALRSVLED